MRPIEELYSAFCRRIADLCEDEANRYDVHPELQDSDQQYIRVLRERCRQWKREAAKLDEAYRYRPA